jgi:OmcA/MtrC family decaheme c-type cytochrome
MREASGTQGLQGRIGKGLGISSLALLLGLSGCNDGGDVIVTSPPAQDSSPTSPSYNQVPGELQVTITDLEVSSPPVVTFSVEDGNGFAFDALDRISTPPSFTIAKLVPGDNGNTNRWQNYINRNEDPTDGVGTGDGSTEIQATTDSGGTLVNNFDGTYTYTFGTDITDPDQTMGVTYVPSLTHRVAMYTNARATYLGEPLPVANASYEEVPASNLTAGIDSRKIVAQETCNSCHGDLAIHGGSRKDVDLCVTCHNPGTTDANSDNTVDFRVMIHKIHMGEELPSVVAGGEYAIWGFRDSKHDYSDVGFPQSPENCLTCHDPDNAATPQAANIVNNPSIEACGACHDDVNFSTGDGHTDRNIAVTNAECSTCHRTGGFAGPVLDSHIVPSTAAGELFEYNILEVTDTAPGQTPTVRFSITNPTAGDAAYNINTADEFTTPGTARLAVILAWNTDDYTNEDSGVAPGKVVSMNPVGSATDNGDGSFSITSGTAIPADVTGSGAAAIEGHPAAADEDGAFTIQAKVKGAVEFFPITDAEAQARRDVVDVAKCQTCHGVRDGLSLHGSNRTDNIQLCVTCHNPRATDLAQRPADPDGIDNEVNTAAVGEDEEQSIDFKRMIHSIHGSAVRSTDYIVYGFGNNSHDFTDLRYPREPSDCQACHLEGTYELPLASSVLGTTIDTEATVNVASPFGTSNFVGDALEQGDDRLISPAAAACSSCHDDATSQLHMEQNGGQFGNIAEEGSNSQGSCAVCHSEGSIADVHEVHNRD